MDAEYHPVMVPLLDTERLADDPWERRPDWRKYESKNVENLLKKELEILRKLLAILETHEDKGSMEYEWKKVAVVLDRVFIIVLTLTIVMCMAAVLVEKPRYDKTLQDIEY